MPDPAVDKWTLQQAYAYRSERLELYGKAGLVENTVISLRKGNVPVPPECGDPETTLQQYETRAAKTKGKIAQPTRVNKKGTLETREQLIERKVAKDIKRAEDVNTELLRL